MSFEDRRNSGKLDSEKGLPGEVTAGLRNERLCEESRSQQRANIRAMKGMRTLKQKKRNRLLAALLAVAMMFQMLPLMAFADGGSTYQEGTPAPVTNERTGQEYDSLRKALKEANDNDTIQLGAGTYFMYDKDHTHTVKDFKVDGIDGKHLTLKGSGIGVTTWQMHLSLDNYYFSYDNCFAGADTITFKNMTLEAQMETGNPYADYRGFGGIAHTVVENCEVNGKTAYWGEETAEFINTTFNAATRHGSEPDYSLWTYMTKEWTFDKCTFNAKGKVINVYTDANCATHDTTINFNNCTVHSNDSKYPALIIDDSNMGSYKYIVNITNPQVKATRDAKTCSQVFGYKENWHSTVTMDGVCVWDNGQMKTHDYTDGEKDQAYEITYSDWRKVNERNDERDVARKCKYCGREGNYTELASVYRLQYDLNGGTGAEGANYDDAFYHERERVALAAAPSCAGYDFVCWKDAAGNTYSAKEETVLKGDTVLTAQWGKEPSEKPAESGESGCGVVSTVLIATGATAIGYYAGTQVLKHCYGLPYWPGNRSALALMLWEDADRPMPVSTVLYPDVGQKERDMDLQHAARWAMENELIPDLNLDDSKPEEEQKFFPNYAVSRAWALHAWNKAQKLKKNA